MAEHRDLLTLHGLCSAAATTRLCSTTFFVDKVELLGYTICNGEATPMLDKMAVMRDYPVPTSITEVRRFWGMASIIVLTSFPTFVSSRRRLTSSRAWSLRAEAGGLTAPLRGDSGSRKASTICGA